MGFLRKVIIIFYLLPFLLQNMCESLHVENCITELSTWMTSETRYLLVQCEYLRSFEYNEKICNDALSVTFFPIGIAFSSSTWRILVYPGVRWVKFNFCSIFICFKHFPCYLYIFTKQKYSKKLTYTLSFQRDHIVLEPTGSDVVNCVSKGKSQVISDWPNYPVVTLLKFPIIICIRKLDCPQRRHLWNATYN